MTKYLASLHLIEENSFFLLLVVWKVSIMLLMIEPSSADQKVLF